jgi:hypothetical protein
MSQYENMNAVDAYVNVLVQPFSDLPNVLIGVPLFKRFKRLEANELAELVELRTSKNAKRSIGNEASQCKYPTLVLARCSKSR